MLGMRVARVTTTNFLLQLLSFCSISSTSTSCPFASNLLPFTSYRNRRCVTNTRARTRTTASVCCSECSALRPEQIDDQTRKRYSNKFKPAQMAPRRSSTSIVINPRKVLGTAAHQTADSDNERKPSKHDRFDDEAATVSSTVESFTEIDEHDLPMGDAYEDGALKTIAIIAKNEVNTGHVEYLAKLAPPFKPNEAIWSLACNFKQVDIDDFEQRDFISRKELGLPVDEYLPSKYLNIEEAMDRAEKRRLAMGIPSKTPSNVVDVRRPGYDGIPLDLVAGDGTPIRGYYRARTAEERAQNEVVTSDTAADR
ncbi:hypothetical protein EJ03DRAFT_181764 [Teratosphaeria nubilosa]|uniref:Uncharacterized protein n=1 Tax=Teratosphaeria nubilosa TaxID=161662 RepID=A0A6G1L295_9PEZI|nr:hypothetical protein EJ03DRAFT_181764 [Teratosphaeria nubilosa]